MTTTKVENFKNQFKLVRGPLFFRVFGEGGAWTPCGPTKDASIELSLEKTTLISGDDGSVLDEQQTAKTATFSVTLQSISNANLALALQSPLRQVAAITDKEVTVPALLPGQAFFLGAKVSQFTATGLVEGEDYALEKASGRITALKATVEAEGTYSTDAVVEMGILANSGAELELMYDATKEGGKRIHLFKWKPSPAQTIAINSGSEHTALTLNGALASAEDATADALLGKFARFISV